MKRGFINISLVGLRLEVIMLLDDTNKPVSAPVFNVPVECPVKINFNQGTYSSSGSLAYHHEMEIQYIRKGQGAYFIRDRFCVRKIILHVLQQALLALRGRQIIDM